MYFNVLKSQLNNSTAPKVEIFDLFQFLNTQRVCNPNPIPLQYHFTSYTHTNWYQNQPKSIQKLLNPQLNNIQQFRTQFNQTNNQPITSYDSNPMYKDINLLSLSFTSPYIPEKMRNNYFNVRLINDDKSNYMINLKYNINQQTNSNI